MVAAGAPDPGAAAAELRARLGAEPFAAALVLGSGLGGLVDALQDDRAVPFEAVGLPSSGVAGHAGRWVGGRLEGRRVLVQAGRYHLYEGHALDLVTAPVRIAAALGVRTLVLTNASGGVRPSFVPGTLMLMERHLDLMTKTALDADLSGPAGWAPWDPELRALAARCADRIGIAVEKGVYAGLLGPSYETPAEIRMLARLGVDAVGMSTVPEGIAAQQAGLRCLGVSLVTNHAAGIAPAPLAHADVIEAGRRAAPRLEALLRAVVRDLPE